MATLELTAIDELCLAITQGAYSPEDLDRIADAIRLRRETATAALHVGQIVEVYGDVGTRYLRGTTWTVKKINPKTVSLHPHNPTPEVQAGRFRYGLRIPRMYVRPAEG